MPRTRIASFSDKMKNSPISPAGSESNHKLRSRKQTSISTNYHGSTADDDGYPVKPEGAKEIRELRSSTRQLLVRFAIFHHIIFYKAFTGVFFC